MSDLRKDPTRGRWVLVRPTRAGHPPTGECPFCPGHESLTRPEISAYRKDGSPPDTPGWSVRVIPEIDPYFGVEHELVREGIGLYDRVSPRGATELIVESPGHGDTPATMREEQWEQVLWMYRERLLDLKRDRSIRDILVTRRHRSPGSRITHPYSRLTAIPIIFDDVRRKLRQCRDYYQYKRRCIYCDIIRQDLADGDRVIHATEHFAVLAPYAARSAFGKSTWNAMRKSLPKPWYLTSCNVFMRGRRPRWRGPPPPGSRAPWARLNPPGGMPEMPGRLGARGCVGAR